MLWLGLVARDTGVAASARLGIKDGVQALAFDIAVSRRLLQHDNERSNFDREFLATLLGAKPKDEGFE